MFIKSSLNFLSSPLISLLLLSGFINTINGSHFTIYEATIIDIQFAFTENKLTSRQLVDFYLSQIQILNPLLHSVLELNPDARDQADLADRERERNQDRRLLGDLHGIPVLLKDSIGTKDKLNTSCGSYALVGSKVASDAGVVERLRRAGAVILGKASLTEWYGCRSSEIPDGWCARAGQGVNPYVEWGNPCGSSSGSAISVAANMVAVSLGTETDGSIICPADHNSVVGLKPTVGLTSRAGVIPISPGLDTIGPICRTVSDAVYVLDAIVGFDPRDYEATKEAAKFIPVGGYKQFLKVDGLKGKRLGIVRNPFLDSYNDSTNPYVPSGNPCGSSSGSAISVAANMVAVSLGSETHGSILCPADHNSVVGFKPTLGLTSRAGVIPVLPRHDTIGSISRTVSDAVYLLDAIAGFDPRDDEATREAAKFIPIGGYKQFLNQDGLKGKRLGVVRNPFLNSLNGSTILPTFECHLDTLRRRGATIVDDLEIANISVILNPAKSGELTAMLAGFKIAVNDYLKELITSPVRSLTDIIAFNENNPDMEKTKEYGQQTFISSEKTSGFGEKERKAVELMEKLSRDGFEKLMAENELDAMVTPGSGCIPVLAIGGYPGITVPAGYDNNGMPFGICFGGVKSTEPKLIEIAYAFEQATMIRRPPTKLFRLKKEVLYESV